MFLIICSSNSVVTREVVPGSELFGRHYNANAMEQRPLREADGSVGSQEIPPTLWQPKVHLRIIVGYKSLGKPPLPFFGCASGSKYQFRAGV